MGDGISRIRGGIKSDLQKLCKTLVLACDPCAEEELFCDQHRSLSDVYRWFLDRYTDEELAAQLRGLAAEEASLGPGKKNRRRTLQRQAELGRQN